MHRALELPGHINLRDLSRFLYAHGIPHKVTEESGKQVVWTGNEEQSLLVSRFYEQWRCGELQLPKAPASRTGINAGALLKSIPWRHMPVTCLFIAACLLVALVTQGGDDWSLNAFLSFAPFQVANGYIYFGTLEMGLEQGQYWRLISPIFLHFGVAHLAFNMLGLYIFGSKLEIRQGSLHLLGIIVFSAVVSNFAQYFWGEQEAIFGGFSGVVYGLMGYCMVREKVDRQWYFGLPPIYYGFMLVWLLIGYTDLFGAIGFGSMANGAHTGGLVAGSLLGAIAGWLFKQK